MGSFFVILRRHGGIDITATPCTCELDYNFDCKKKGSVEKLSTFLFESVAPEGWNYFDARRWRENYLTDDVVGENCPAWG